MNVIEPENQFIVEAKICGCNNNNNSGGGGSSSNNNEKKKSISYNFIESAHNLCLDKKEITYAQIQACKRLLKHIKVKEEEASVIKREIIDLHRTLGAIENIKNMKI